MNFVAHYIENFSSIFICIFMNVNKYVNEVQCEVITCIQCRIVNVGSEIHPRYLVMLIKAVL